MRQLIAKHPDGIDGFKGDMTKTELCAAKDSDFNIDVKA